MSRYLLRAGRTGRADGRERTEQAGGVRCLGIWPAVQQKSVNPGRRLGLFAFRRQKSANSGRRLDLFVLRQQKSPIKPGIHGLYEGFENKCPPIDAETWAYVLPRGKSPPFPARAGGIGRQAYSSIERIRFTISMAPSAQEEPLLPAFTPARFSACSTVSVVTIPNMTGTPVSRAAWAIPFEDSLQT